MTAATALNELGPLQRQEHSHLPEGTGCYYWGEYTPAAYTQGRPVWEFSETNQLILNFKKSLDRKGHSDWYYKEQAIGKIAKEFSKSFNARSIRNNAALIPMPPSRDRNDPKYDDRMLRVLEKLSAISGPFDVRDCLSFDGQYAASHESSARPTPDQLFESMTLEIGPAKPLDYPALILLFDDVLTTGAHFQAATRRLASYFPQTEVVGIFVARTVRPVPSLDELPDISEILKLFKKQ